MKKLCFLIVAVCGILICGINDTYAQSATTGAINGHAWVDLGLSVKWATCNVGASSPEQYGNYFAWGEIITKNTYTKDNNNTYDLSDIVGDGRYDVATAKWGSSWRIPTDIEIQELIDNCTWTWTNKGGINGYMVKSKKNGNSIFLPAAGVFEGDSLINKGTWGIYRSSTPVGAGCTSILLFDDVDIYIDLFGYREFGYSVRPVVK